MNSSIDGKLFRENIDIILRYIKVKLFKVRMKPELGIYVGYVEKYILHANVSYNILEDREFSVLSHKLCSLMSYPQDDVLNYITNG